MPFATRRELSRLAQFFLVMRCFNVAAITALAVWHGYAFYTTRSLSVMPLHGQGDDCLCSINERRG
ncbi:hypothetical protein A9Y76_08050 [Ralstonia insidiosa]|uniref:Uncharacterized protein n=1 Tax=Ralstonia insidiosa TaxID=190721 RepID=A0A191ZW90_9RALS|nr:hypothetical protein A9Y76_08050 [Ralstonia insidiosa]